MWLSTALGTGFGLLFACATWIGMAILAGIWMLCAGEGGGLMISGITGLIACMGTVFVGGPFAALAAALLTAIVRASGPAGPQRTIAYVLGPPLGIFCSALSLALLEPSASNLFLLSLPASIIGGLGLAYGILRAPKERAE